MSLLDIPIRDTTVEQASDAVRSHLRAAVLTAETKLANIRQLVQEHTRAAIAAELGDDAAKLLTVYNALKQAVDTAKDVVTEDLP